MIRNGKEYTRVTDVLDPFGLMDEIPPHYLKAAGERGTDVHKALDAYIKGLGMDLEDPCNQGYVDSAIPWIHNKNFIANPGRIWDDDLMLTGECDGIYIDADEAGRPIGVLVDFKTSSKESKTWPLQGSAYAYLLRKSGYQINRVEFVHLKKNGKECKVYIYKEDFSMYLKCLDIYRYFEMEKRRRD